MDDAQFEIVTKEAKGVCCVAMAPPDYPSDDLVLKFLDGPLEGMFARIDAFNLKKER